MVFNARLLKEAKNNKEHWFWVAKHLPKRVKGLENRWYGSEKSVICFLLLQTGWFNRAEAVELSYRLENLAKERSKQLLSQKAKERMQNEKRRLSLSLKIKEKWKDIEYKNKTIEKLRLSVEKQKLKNSLTKLSKNTLDKLIYEFLEKNYEKIKNKVKVIENPIVEIDEKFRGWLKLKQKEKGSDLYLEYCVLLEPLAALYLLYCLENKKVLLFKELERLDQEFAQLLELVYKKEEDILNLIEKKIELINPK
ncbi:MAG: hypothetical protein N3D10_00695 [Candidatus Micrarchaeota archaeon]|nr:hypothetical protein [Candidatus Micrarchaeota archaeon]